MLSQGSQSTGGGGGGRGGGQGESSKQTGNQDAEPGALGTQKRHAAGITHSGSQEQCGLGERKAQSRGAPRSGLEQVKGREKGGVGTRNRTETVPSLSLSPALASCPVTLSS